MPITLMPYDRARGAGSVYSTVEQGDGDIPMEDGKTVHGGTIGL